MNVKLPAPGPNLKSFDEQKVGFFRFRRLNGHYLLTTETGKFAYLNPQDFDRFVQGRLGKTSAAYRDLKSKGFLREHLDFPGIVKDWRKANSFLWMAPSLHMIVVTLRCNYTCVYCHAASVKMTEKHFDMTKATAEKVVDRIFESPSPVIAIEFQGGEPLVNYPVVQHIVEYALEKNKTVKKDLLINMVSNMSLMDEKKLGWLMEHGVNFCTSIDGPAALHDKNRIYTGGASHAVSVRWFKEIYKRTAKKMFRIDALLTATRSALPLHREVVDEYLKIGARGIYLRSLNPFGFAGKTWEAIGYTPEEFLTFYRKAVDYIIGINLKGKPFVEQYAKICLTKILNNEDPGFIDMRSPYGLGGLAYNYDGGVYLADEGRMVAKMGDESFRLGNVFENTYKETVNHETMRAVVSSSLLEGQTECSWCAYKPYCGQSPIHNYIEQGDIYARTPTSNWHLIHQGIFDYLFMKIKDPKALKVFRSWVSKRKPRTLYARN